MFTQSGIPVIYSGDEVGQLNDYMYHADINKKFDSRYLHRGKLDWKLADERKKAGSYQEKIFSALRKLETIRAENEVFVSQADFYPIETGSQNVLGLYRGYGKQKLIALFNFSEREHTVPFGEKVSYTDLYSSKKHNSKDVKLKPYAFLWALVK